MKYFTDIISQNTLQKNTIKEQAKYSLFYSTFYDIIKHYTPELFSSLKVDLYKDFLLPLEEDHSHSKYEDIKNFIFQIKILQEKEIINKTIKNTNIPIKNSYMKKRI